MLVGSLFVFWVFFLFIFYAKRIDHHVNMAVNQAFNESGTTGSVTYCRVGHRFQFLILIPVSNDSQFQFF